MFTAPKDSVSISKVTRTKAQQMMKALEEQGYAVLAQAAPDADAPVPAQGGYRWDDREESLQAPECKTWLADRLSLQRDLAWVPSSRQLLDVDLEWLPFKLKGGLDIALAAREFVSTGYTSRGLRVVFELKKVVTEADNRQALAEFVAADALSAFEVLHVLTDLNAAWRFHFVEDDHIVVVSEGLSLIHI